VPRVHLSPLGKAALYLLGGYLLALLTLLALRFTGVLG
jgi:hypothetical protein